MKLLTCTLVLLLLFSCARKTDFNKVENVKPSGSISIRESQTKIAVIDNCEYIIYEDATSMAWGSHKGNCKYCEERKKYAR